MVYCYFAPSKNACATLLNESSVWRGSLCESVTVVQLRPIARSTNINENIDTVVNDQRHRPRGTTPAMPFCARHVASDKLANTCRGVGHDSAYRRALHTAQSTQHQKQYIWIVTTSEQFEQVYSETFIVLRFNAAGKVKSNENAAK